MRRVLYAAIAAIFVPPLQAQELPADVRAEILSRCRTTMEDYGAAMVQACADQDIEAEKALQDF